MRLKNTITFILFASFMLMSSAVYAGTVDVLINTLKTSKNYKVRVTAAMLLSKRKNSSKVFSALLYAMNHDKHITVRGTAALALGKLGNKSAMPYLKKAAKSSKRYLRKMARKAIKLLQNQCPKVNFKGKMIYLNIGPMGVKGFSSGKKRLISYLRTQLAKSAEKISYVTPYWPKCKTPSRRDLRKKKLKGYMVDGTMIISHSGGELSCTLKLFVTTFPGKSIKMMNSANAALTGNLDFSTVNTCIEAVIPVAFQGVQRYLATHL